MITSIVTLFLASFEPNRNPILKELLEDGYSYYEVKYRIPHENFSLKCTAGVVMHVSVSPRNGHPPQGYIDSIKRWSQRPNQLDDKPIADDMPGGLAHRCGVNSAGGFFLLVGDAKVIRADLLPTFEKKGKGSKLNPAPDKLIERFVPMVRWQLAIVEGDGLDKDARWGGRSWVSLRGAASTNRFELLENVQAARYAVNTPKGQVILPLASFQAKIGSNWVDAGGMILIRNNEPYIPQKLANELKTMQN